MEPIGSLLPDGVKRKRVATRSYSPSDHGRLKKKVPKDLNEDGDCDSSLEITNKTPVIHRKKKMKSQSKGRSSLCKTPYVRSFSPVKVFGEGDNDLGTETPFDLFSQPAQFQDEQLSSMYRSTQNDVRPSTSGAVVPYLHGLGQFDLLCCNM